MKKIWLMLLALMLAFSATGFAEGTENGSLVIVGGALRADNNAVYERFIELAGGADEAKVAVVPAASGSPHKYAKMFEEDMLARGLTEDQIVHLPLAVKDDSRSEDVDESNWANNGTDPEVAAMLEDVTGVWFVGGDQMRITDVLLADDGSRTVVLDAIWDVYDKGGVIGGTSAGVAIMSEVMIAGGDSLGALTLGEITSFDDSTPDYQNQGGLVTTEGLGFFEHGLTALHA